MTSSSNQSEERPLLSSTSSSDLNSSSSNSPPTSTSSNQRLTYTNLITKNLFGSSFVLLAQISLISFLLQLWFILYKKPAGLFTYHPSLNSLAVAGFTQGVLLLQPTSTKKEKEKGLNVHQVFQYTALPLILAGTSLIIYNKIIHDAQHFTSYHGLFAIITLTLILIQIGFGAIMIYAPLTHILGGEMKAKSWWKFHRLSGYITLSLLYITPLLAVQSGWMLMNSTQTERIIMTLGLTGTAIGVTGRIRKSKLGL